MPNTLLNADTILINKADIISAPLQRKTDIRHKTIKITKLILKVYYEKKNKEKGNRFG